MNEVIHSDCLQVMPTLPDKSIDMILCDLPYGTTACKWDTVIPFEPLWKQYKRLIKDNGLVLFFAQGLFTAKVIMSNECDYRYTVIWDKQLTTGFLQANKMPLRVHEEICVFYQNPATYNPQKTVGKKSHSKGSQVRDVSGNNYHKVMTLDNSEKHGEMKYPKSIIVFQKPHPSTAIHPTQKPVALFEYLIKTYTNEGETVLDNCAGSGTTAIACLNTNRNYILIEKEKEYIDIINKRIAEHEQQLSIT